ncbi:hypothetical protein GCM10025331_49300 [Actinoplanes utahensis]|nr:hypothetical protein Aut01nite_56350 [Actinoplanes utahensis]
MAAAGVGLVGQDQVGAGPHQDGRPVRGERPTFPDTSDLYLTAGSGPPLVAADVRDEALISVLGSVGDVFGLCQ